MSTIAAPPWLERLVTACLGAEPQDPQLGDLSEQYARTLERAGGSSLSRVAAGLHYAAAAANVVLFTRVVDPVVRWVEDGALGLLEKLMNTMRRLAIPAVLLACSAFLVFSAVTVWQDWRRSEALLQAQQHEKAEVLAQRIEAFVGDVWRQLGWIGQAQWAALPVEQKRFDLVRLLRQTAAVGEVTFLDGDGHEQLEVSRLKMDVVGAGTDRSADPAFVEAKQNRFYVGPVYVRRNSEPYLTMAVALGGGRGVIVVSINLKTVLDLVAQAKADTGYAYVVDGQGRLVAHPDIKLVLNGTDMKGLPQVVAAFATTGHDKLLTGTNRSGADVWSVQAPVKGLGWRVFVELPVAETRAAFWIAMTRAGGLLLLAVAAALVAFRLGMRPGEPSRLARA